MPSGRECPIWHLINHAGVKPEATQIVGRSVDGFTVGFPRDVAFDGRPALVAVGMNGEALPFTHGFPARLIVSGLFGYVSATKWLQEIELTTWEGFNGYWIPRGWSKRGPVKLQSRIDVPRRSSTVRPGRQPIAGVAWAQNRGISKVEVQIDGGDWKEARLALPISKHTWVQWGARVGSHPGIARGQGARDRGQRPAASRGSQAASAERRRGLASNQVQRRRRMNAAVRNRAGGESLHGSNAQGRRLPGT